jgi:hypothetical protein
LTDVLVAGTFLLFVDGVLSTEDEPRRWPEAGSPPLFRDI